MQCCDLPARLQLTKVARGLVQRTGVPNRGPVCRAGRLMLDSEGIAHVVDGAVCLVGGPVGSFSIDTRQSLMQHWYIALRGKSHDGHAFVSEALEQGVGVVVDNTHMASLPGKSLVSEAQRIQKGIVVVPDTTKALTELAKHTLAQYQGEVIAVTGSVGKTTCKSMIAHTLELFQQHVSQAPASFNNNIGVPLTAMSIPDSDVALFELGTSQCGDIAALTSIVSADIRVISDVQPSHLAGFPTQDMSAVLEEKLQLFETARPTDSLVFNAANNGVWRSLLDTPCVGAAARPALAQPHKSLWAFADAEQLCSTALHDLCVADQGLQIVMARGITCSLHMRAASGEWEPQTSFQLCLHGCKEQQEMFTSLSEEETAAVLGALCIFVRVPALGRQIGVNAALAAATACAWMERKKRRAGGAAYGSRQLLPWTCRRIAEGVMHELHAHAWLQSWSLPAGRMTMHQLSEEVIVLDDTYNAQPASVMSALHTIRDLHVRCHGGVAVSRLCVLGGMAELGDQELSYHQQVFEAVCELEQTSAILWGSAWSSVAVDTQSAAEQLQRKTWFGSAEDVCSVVECVLEWIAAAKAKSCNRCLAVILLKGSRQAKVERVLEHLLGHDL